MGNLLAFIIASISKVLLTHGMMRLFPLRMGGYVFKDQLIN
jgi:hypothetical protein